MSKRRKLVKSSSNPSWATKALGRTATPVPLHLPNEIILAILAPLAFNDLKSTRLLSKPWCFCASTLLLTSISVSPNKEGLKIFKAITEHPQLRKCVRHLWYGGSEFLLDLSKRQYLKDLWRQWRHWHSDHTLLEFLHGSDTDISSWVRYVVHNNMGCADVMAKFRNAKFVKDGYQKYH